MDKLPDLSPEKYIDDVEKKNLDQFAKFENNYILDEQKISSNIEEKLRSHLEESTIWIVRDALKKEITANCVGYINRKNLKSLFIGQEPWPEDVKLYQPYETEQILLPDMANCLSVQAFLKICNLDFSVEYKANAEDMSPSGKVPFIKCGACLVSELEPITNFVASKGYSLTSNLDAVQKADMRAYMSLVNTVLGNAENYISWVEPETYWNVTKPRYGSVHPFPLNHYLPYLKRRQAIKRLNSLGWYNKSIDKVYEEVDRACRALSERLGNQRYFFGDQPTELDALLFAHMYGTLIFPGFPSGLKLADALREHPLLMKHCKTLKSQFGFLENVDCPVLHTRYKRSLPGLGAGDAELGEFVFDDTDEDEEISKNDYTQIAQDYSCLVNEPNPIYESVFGLPRNDLELGSL